MENNELLERNNYIEKLKAMGFKYEFEKYKTNQLKIIYIKSMEARKAICKEIADLGREVGNHYNITNLYHSHKNIDELRGIKSRLKKEQYRLGIVNRIMELANFFEKDQNFILQNMFLGPKSTEDLEDVLFKLEKELYELELEYDRTHKTTINYDADFALGDDPILDKVDIQFIIPKEKVIGIIKTLYFKKKEKKQIFISRTNT